MYELQQVKDFRSAKGLLKKLDRLLNRRLGTWGEETVRDNAKAIIYNTLMPAPKRAILRKAGFKQVLTYKGTTEGKRVYTFVKEVK